jgi:prepilin-type N-terminal cleavage/methylation domain-containing protein
MTDKGFTLMEVVVTLAIIGILSTGLYAMVAPTPEARVVACQGGLAAHEALVEQAAEQTFPFIPTWDEVQDIAGERWDAHYHYVPNLEDTNNGHGNDLDLCDGGNPGESLQNRTCLNIMYIIVCDHDHSDLAKYGAVLSGDGPMVFGGNPEHEFLKPLRFFSVVHPNIKDPNLQKWVGGY